MQDFAAGTVDYDVCWDHSSFFSQYVKVDGLEPLEGYFTADDLKDFIPRLVDAHANRRPSLGDAPPLRHLLHALPHRPGR